MDFPDDDPKPTWIHFLNLIGAKWSNLSDPLAIGAQTVRMDFRVNYEGEEFILAVRPKAEQLRIKPQRVYLAGNLQPDWRGIYSPLMPNAQGEFPDQDFISLLGNTRFKVVGPFAAGNATGVDTFSTSFNAIDNADILCAHVDTIEAYRTVAEITHAFDNKKIISISLASDLARKLGWKGNFMGVQKFVVCKPHDLWFPCVMTKYSRIVFDVETAQNWHGDIIRHHTDREYRLISTFGLTQPTAIAFGWPANCCYLQWGAPAFERCMQQQDEASTAEVDIAFAGSGYR